jgi:AcrR family transcriptional regulator
MGKDKSPSDSPFNRSAQHDAKRLAILSEAARLFNYKGSRATTLRDIADGLGLTKTSLYYYVKTKEELVYQCYLATLEHQQRSLDAIEQKYARPGERASAFFLQQFDDWLAARQGTGPHIAALLEIASLKGRHRKKVEAGYVAMFKRLRGYLREGIKADDMRAFETTSATRALLGSMDWIFSWLHQVSAEEVHSTAREALDILSAGLSSGAGEYEAGHSTLPEPVDNALQGFDRAQQNRLKQEAFYKTGTWFFNKQGFNGTSLDEIAEQLNVSKGAFYYHIKNKEDLLFNCYSRSLDIVDGIYAQVGDSDASGLEKIELACRHIFRAQNSGEGPLIRYTSITNLPMQRRKAILARTDAVNERFAEFISQGIADGSVREVNPVIAQQLISGAVNASMDIGLWRKVDDIDAAAIDYFDIFFNGLLPRPRAR